MSAQRNMARSMHCGSTASILDRVIRGAPRREKIDQPIDRQERGGDRMACEPFLTPRTIPRIGLAVMAITTMRTAQWPIERDSITVALWSIRGSRHTLSRPQPGKFNAEAHHGQRWPASRWVRGPVWIHMSNSQRPGLMVRDGAFAPPHHEV
jgi:hypothetical protein